MKFLRHVIAVLVAAGLLASVVAMPAQSAPESPGSTLDRAMMARRYTFPQLDKNPVARLRTIDNPMSITFGVRADETVKKAVLKVRYAYSPVMIPIQSHIKVLLNGEIIGVLPMTQENAGRRITHELEIDPALIKDFNKLSLELIGHYTAECEDPLHLNLWADVERGSELLLTVQPVEVAGDLALLPKPFFDLLAPNAGDLPFIFNAKPSYATLRAAAITASWFGELASWRGAHFAAYLDAVPKGHAVVFATNTERPGFLSKAAPFTGPGLSILTNPGDGYSKLLLVSGRDGDDLKIAANALVLGNAAMSGTHVSITQSHQQALRHAYDAPSWIRLDRPTKFGELVDSPQQLQVYGHMPESVLVSLRVPPDLFTWHSRGVPVDLRFRYTPMIRTGDSQLAMSINGEPVQAMNLRLSGQGAESRLRIPLLDSGLLGDTQQLLIPAFKLGVKNQLQYTFTFGDYIAGPCRDTPIDNIVAMIDPNSEIDFSGFPHYAEMPHLGYFATSGFPFTEYADLAQTVVVLPEAVTAQDIKVMLTLMGRMGESTGYPATRVDVVGPTEQAAFTDRDMLLIGTVSSQVLLDKWSSHLPAIIAGPQRKIRKPAGVFDGFYSMLGISNDPAADPKRQTHVRGNGPLAALLGFESPITPRRSVVAVTAVDPADMMQLLDTLRSDDVTQSMHGSVVLFYGGNVESIFAGKIYKLGALPIWTTIWFALADHPFLLASMSVLVVLIFAFALWRMLKRIADRRL
ncbi:MAG: cellulose biosynthesis cyclic di-GMP-binding regulatory protein BcsB [Burkholderiales bacterium]